MKGALTGSITILLLVKGGEPRQDSDCRSLYKLVQFK